MSLMPGTRVGPYEILEPLGAGGMGEVYRARDPRLGRDVAVKLVTTDGTPSPDRLRRFETEARAAAQLSHPNVVTVFDVGSHDGQPYLVLELLKGRTLRETLRSAAPSLREAISWGLESARGLAAAHERGIVHRDLKPENVFLTDDGRVKVLDFGLAKLHEPLVEESERASPTEARGTKPGMALGTVGHMAPEQVRGETPDARTDVFALGTVLFELVTRRRPFGGASEGEVLAAILRDEPPAPSSLLPAVPPALDAAVRRCLAKPPAERFSSAREVAAALETVLASFGAGRFSTARPPEPRGPYPGLEWFRESDTERFFGREAEVETLWARLHERRLLGVIGPSGVGKTSFVRAGVLAARPAGWAAIVCAPGASPFRSLGQALAPELAEDTEALRQLVGFDDLETALGLIGRWRRAHGEALLVVDQLEELFTLSPGPEQARFAELIGRVATEADVHVVLSMRDDFLMRCSEHDALARVFTELTPLRPLSGDALRRALVEPAKREGYTFEEGLVVEMLRAVEGARGALPLLAFVMSRLWQKRDLDNKRLTRATYEEIGGVAGALAQHAEATLERIGEGRQPLVREIFRNLVTAQGTRAPCEREELLSTFPDRGSVEKALERLIDARLLTSYEATEPARGAVGTGDSAPSSRGVRPGSGDEGSAWLERKVHRIEIVHESLLKAWPRLVWWQAQDEEGAQLRDQLRQAAHLWEERGRSGDLLWTGTAEREFEVWHERYPGQLSAVEDDFARAMIQRARRRKRMLRVAVAVVVLGLSTVAGVIAVSRHQEALARREAEAQARRAEGEKLLALGQARLAESPTEALALALAGLEVHDSPGTRRFVVEALSKGPPAHRLPHGKGDLFMKVAFSREGRWLAAAGSVPEILVWADDGKLVNELRRPVVDVPWPPLLRFVPGGDLLAMSEYLDGAGLIRFWSVPQGKLVHQVELEGPTFLVLNARQFVTATAVGTWGNGRVNFRAWPPDGGDSRALGAVDFSRLGAHGAHGIDPTGMWVAEARGDGVRLRRLDGAGGTPGRVIARPSVKLRQLEVGPRGSQLAAADEAGDIHIWPVGSEPGIPPRTLPGPPESLDDMGRLWSGPPESLKDMGRLRFSPDGSRLAVEAPLRTFLWDLEGPPEADPLELVSGHTAGMQWFGQATYEPRGLWLARAVGVRIDLWPIEHPFPSVLRGAEGSASLAFTPDSRWLASASWDGKLRLWPLSPGVGARRRVLLEEGALRGLSVDPLGRHLAVTQKFDGAVFVVPLSGGEPRRLTGFSRDALLKPAASGPEGRLVAAASNYDPQGPMIRVWDLETGDVHELNPRDTDEVPEDPKAGGVWGLRFTPDRHLLSVGKGGVRRWDLEHETSEMLWVDRAGRAQRLVAIDVSADERYVLTQRVDAQGAAASEVFVEDLENGRSTALTSHGGLVTPVAFDSERGLVVTGDRDGIVRVGPLSGDEPHLLCGDGERIDSVALSPDGQWVAAATVKGAIRLWPMPDISQTPFHALPYEELMARLRSLTNLRAVPDDRAPGGYRVEIGPFPGWADVPEW